jgi:hypothetical protein
MKRIISALLILLVLPCLAMAEAKAATQRLMLEFVDGPDLTVTKADKTVAKLGSGIFEGDEVPVGATIATGASTSVELKLKPNGTIIRIAKSTTFKVAALSSPASKKNAFALVAGKVRAVAAKGGEYEMTSQSAACAVRGTDFAFSVEDGKALLMVAKGLVQMDKLDEAGASLGSIPVAAGEAADALASSFASFAYSAEEYAAQYADLAFQKLSETDVPEKAIDTEEEPAAAAATPATPAATPATTAPAKPAEPAAKAPEKPSAPAPESALAKWMREALGFEIGTVSINEKSYSKAVIQPNLVLGKLKLGLYLPIIYTSNLFDPNDWYQPKGNNEWDFGYEGFAKGDYAGGAIDLATDLALKIKYLEYGEQYKDPFFLKTGNLDSITLGHGLIMRNYANDTDFPSVRRLGFDMGLDLSGGGFELVANDLTDPEIFGGRLFVRPIKGFKLALGASAVTDWNPAAGNAALEASDGGLKLIGTGVDLDLPIIQSQIFGIRLFGDGAVTLPITASGLTSSSGAPIAAGLQYQLAYDEGSYELKNWGASAGLLGNVAFIDYRLEYRYTTGFFKASLFDSTYDRMRNQYAAQYLEYLENPASYASLPDLMGVYGEGSMRLFKDKLSLTLGYYWPWSLEAGTDIQKQLVSSSDEFHARLQIKKGLIPVVDVAGSIFYDKRGLARDIANGSFSFLDSNTVFGGEISVPVPKTPNLDLAVIFATVPVLNADGSYYYSSAANAAAGIIELKPSVTIETRFHF